MMKKRLSLALAATMALSMAVTGCGGGGRKNLTNDPSLR